MSVSASAVAYAGESSLGWLAVAEGSAGVVRVTFGHASELAAQNSLLGDLTSASPQAFQWSTGESALLARLQDFADGAPDEFGDVQLDFTGLSRFQSRVLEHCRRIPYGETTSYGQLAARAGSPNAARAVGSTMAANRWPLIVPCHRVVQAGGRLGNYSAPQGVRMKKRLLAMESDGVLV